MTGPTPLGDWLASRDPAPPRPLAARIAALATTGGPPSGTTPASELLQAAEAAMREVLREGCLTRESALELLAVDGLVTYAFEAAADHPESLELLAGDALARIAALAAPNDA